MARGATKFEEDARGIEGGKNRRAGEETARKQNLTTGGSGK